MTMPLLLMTSAILAVTACSGRVATEDDGGPSEHASTDGGSRTDAPDAAPSASVVKTTDAYWRRGIDPSHVLGPCDDNHLCYGKGTCANFTEVAPELGYVCIDAHPCVVFACDGARRCYVSDNCCLPPVQCL